MLFEIERASDRNNERPCQQALKKGYTWYVEINSLEELAELQSQCGDLVLGKKSILIYDDYIE